MPPKGRFSRKERTFINFPHYCRRHKKRYDSCGTARVGWPSSAFPRPCCCISVSNFHRLWRPVYLYASLERTSVCLLICSFIPVSTMILTCVSFFFNFFKIHFIFSGFSHDQISSRLLFHINFQCELLPRLYFIVTCSKYWKISRTYSVF